MSLVGLAAFNLLLNAIPAFALAWLFSRATLRLLRIPPGRVALGLSSLPFVKLAYDLAGGIPARAFLWQRAAGVPRDLGTFQMGAGTHWGLLRVDLSLGALAGGTQYPDSAADIAAALLTKRVSIWAPLVVATLLLSVSLWRLGARMQGWLVAARRAREIRGGQPVGFACGKRRSFPIHLVGDHGSPFSGGLWRGYICFPRALWHALPESERAAAIAHEAGHLAERHLLVSLAAGVIEDLFWFVPGMASARRRLSEAIEGAADQWAIDRGHSPVVLASALIRVAEATAPARFAHGTCNATGASTSARIDRLLADRAPTPRLGCQRPLVRAAFFVWAAGSLLIAIAFGNH